VPDNVVNKDKHKDHKGHQPEHVPATASRKKKGGWVGECVKESAMHFLLFLSLSLLAYLEVLSILLRRRMVLPISPSVREKPEPWGGGDEWGKSEEVGGW
jgi:hypothetical protein